MCPLSLNLFSHFLLLSLSLSLSKSSKKFLKGCPNITIFNCDRVTCYMPHKTPFVAPVEGKKLLIIWRISKIEHY